MESVLRGIAVYAFLLVIVRITGRRTLAEVTVFDFVLILIVAETTQQALLGDDFSITNAIILITTLFTVDVGLSYVKRWFPTFRKFLEGRPTMLIHDCKIDERALRRARVSKDDIFSSARSVHGLESMDQIKHAVLETDGHISIIPKRAS